MTPSPRRHPCAAVPLGQREPLALVLVLLSAIVLLVRLPASATAADVESFTLWAGVEAPGRPIAWHARQTYADRGACEAGRQAAREATRRGLAEAGVRDLVPVGEDGWARLDEDRLVLYVFRFRCLPGGHPPRTSATMAPRQGVGWLPSSTTQRSWFVSSRRSS